MKKRNIRNKLGLAAMEMALTLPVFCLLLFGVMDTARLFWMQSVVRDAAFEGARMAILHEPTNEQIQTIIEEELRAGGIADSVSVSIGSREAEQPVDVTVSVPFEFMVIGGFILPLHGGFPLSATAVMTHER